MRILVLQLARFGDIYQSWPALRALQRKHPTAELHIAVRARFREALTGLSGWTVHALPTVDILGPIIKNGDTDGALSRLDAFVQPLAALEFDEIINLTFSPVSSYLTDSLAANHSQVRGYTRHSDGFLSIPDDSSAYFYAQVGIGRRNRYHLTEVFAAVAQVELTEADFAPPAAVEKKNRILLHLGASQAQKIYPPELWVETAALLRESFDGEIEIVGSQDERGLADTVCEQVPGLKNRAGQTRLHELMPLIQESRLLIGGDSAPIHMASLTATPTLNLSSNTVCFWETGPLAPGSRVLFADNLADLRPQRIASEAMAMLNGKAPSSACFVRHPSERTYQPVGCTSDDFAWNLIQALYTGTPYPAVTSAADKLAFQRLFELAELALQQIARWDSTERSVAARILASVDEMLTEIPKLCPNVEPVVQWFQTQRLRMPPGEAAQTLEQTRKLFEELLWVTAVYHQSGNQASDIQRAVELCAACAPLFREFDVKEAEPDFQKLITTLQELSRHSTNVGDKTWSSVLNELVDAMSAQDFIRLADMLEYELPQGLARLASENETFAEDVIF